METGEVRGGTLKVFLSETDETLEDIAKEIMNCRKCDLWKAKTNYVPGEGSENAEVVFVGEAPGREEDRQGRPFVGNAGKLLNELLSSIGLRREDVFIGNVLKCRPPNNRDPKPEEVEACSPYLIRQLNVIKPDVIVCLGRYSASFIFDLFGIPFRGISRERGEVKKVRAWDKDVFIIPVYHPAAALYKPQLKEVLEEDFKKIGALLRKKKKNPTLSDFGIG